MPLDPRQRPPVMCITLDGHALSHLEQTRALCAAGARWIQLRMKDAPPDAWLATARGFVALCRAHGATAIINDNVDLALAAGAAGVHLGKEDLDWSEARRRLGPARILGGTVNNPADAARASACGALDYVGVGPLRFTATKRRLAPVLGLDGIRDLLPRLGDLPAWVIGGVLPDDLPAIRAIGAHGAAVSSGLFSSSHAAYLTAWSANS